jgi:nucleoside-diphosphate-sugar epimerase
MEVLVAGAAGLIGSRAVAGLREHRVHAVSGSRRDGVDVVTGKGLADATHV